MASHCAGDAACGAGACLPIGRVVLYLARTRVLLTKAPESWSRRLQFPSNI
jgi:hypothetical protein